jgi:RimJ/RimL family protein N-acetyltransferase
LVQLEGSGIIAATRALADSGFARMRPLRLVTVTHPDNARSVRLLMRLGLCLDPAPAARKPRIMGILPIFKSDATVLISLRPH